MTAGASPVGAPLSRGGVVAIDGVSGSGKSTLARALARRLGWRYLDTGAMYRAVALAALERGVPPDDTAAVALVVADLDLRPGLSPDHPRIWLDGRDVTDAVRGPEVTAAVSAVAAAPAVRDRLTRQQRDLAADGSIVVEGRDIGSVVLPHAGLKVWLTVDPATAGERRARDEGATPAEQVLALTHRDRADAGRSVAPAAPAPDAIHLDSSSRSVAELVAVLAERLAAGEAAAGDAAMSGAGAAEAAAGGAAAGGAAPAGDGVAGRRGPYDAGGGAAVPPFVRKRRPSGAAATRAARWFGRAVVRPALDVTAEGLDAVPSSGPVLLVANHVSALDGPVLYAVSPRPARFLVKAEAYRPPLSVLLAAIDQWPVNRGRADRTALVAARTALIGGGVVALFPEGTRGDGSVARVHDGTGWLLAHVPTAAVVPVALHHGAARRGVQVHVGAPLVLRPEPERTRAAFRRLALQVAEGLAAHVAATRAPTTRNDGTGAPAPVAGGDRR